MYCPRRRRGFQPTVAHVIERDVTVGFSATATARGREARLTRKSGGESPRFRGIEECPQDGVRAVLCSSRDVRRELLAFGRFAGELARTTTGNDNAKNRRDRRIELGCKI